MSDVTELIWKGIFIITGGGGVFLILRALYGLIKGSSGFSAILLFILGLVVLWIAFYIKGTL